MARPRGPATRSNPPPRTWRRNTPCRTPGHDPGGRGDGDDEARALSAHDRKHRSRDVHRTEHGGLDLRPEVLRTDLLEESGVEVARVVDQNVDVSEPVHGSPDAYLRVRRIGGVELDGQDVLVLA